MGNHDAAACGLEEPWFFNSKAQAAIEWQGDRLRDDNCRWLASLPPQLSLDGSALAVHGAPGNRDDYIMDWLDAMRQIEFLAGTGVAACFFGHSHLASLVWREGEHPEHGCAGAVFAQSGQPLFHQSRVGRPTSRSGPAGGLWSF